MSIASLKKSVGRNRLCDALHRFPAGTVMPLKRRMALLESGEGNRKGGILLKMIMTVNFVTVGSPYLPSRALMQTEG